MTHLMNGCGRVRCPARCRPVRQPLIYFSGALLFWVAARAFAAGNYSQPPSPQEIVNLSIKSTQTDWKAAPEFSNVELDEDTRGGERSSKTYHIWMLDGSPYSQLIEINGDRLPPAQNAQECRKLQAEIERRANESSPDRARRVRAYQEDESRRFAVISEMADAFDFNLLRHETLDNRGVYVIAATPRPDYQPKSWKTRILKGMKGTLWIDDKTYQWVKVEAIAVRPVDYGGIIARVLPGTRFLLKQSPIKAGLWLPEFFSLEVRARVLGWHREYTHSETYSDYRPEMGNARPIAAIRPSPCNSKRCFQ